MAGKVAAALTVALVMSLAPAGVAEASWKCNIPGYSNPSVCSKYRNLSNAQLLSIYKRLHRGVSTSGMQPAWVTPRMRTEMLKGLDAAGSAIRLATYRTFPGPVGAGGKLLYISLARTASGYLTAAADLRATNSRGAIAVVATQRIATSLVACAGAQRTSLRSTLCLG